MITRIRIPARWPNDERTDNYAVAVFGLGLGPCGKTVTKLEYDLIEEQFFVVVQYCESEKKSFFYPIQTLTGRVEITED